MILNKGKFKIINKFIKNKKAVNPLTIFIFFFIISFVSIYFFGVIDQFPGNSDAYYYVHIENYFNKIFKNFFHVLSCLFSRGF